MGNVTPLWVCRFNQLEFPLARPFLDILFTLNGFGQKLVGLQPDEGFNAVFGSEAGGEAILMLVETPGQVTGDAGIERSVAF